MAWAGPVSSTTKQWVELGAHFKNMAQAGKGEKCFAAQILADLYADDLIENKVFLNEFLAKEVQKLLRLVRARAKAHHCKRVWVRNEQIFVRKFSDAEIISISSESDFNCA